MNELKRQSVSLYRAAETGIRERCGMDSISAVTVLLVLFAFGDVVAERTKGIISMVFQ